jgi:hypothetical protein
MPNNSQHQVQRTSGGVAQSVQWRVTDTIRQMFLYNNSVTYSMDANEPLVDGKAETSKIF